MPAQHPAQSRATTTRLIHFALATGVTLLAITMVALRQTGRWSAAPQPPVLGLVLGGVGVVLIAFSFAIMRPRVEARGSTESRDEFWNARRSTAALLVWAPIEGGALMSAVGYGLTGLWTPLAVVPIALIAFFLTRPSTMDGG